MARFVVEVIDGLDLSAFSKRYRGTGSLPYHPTLLLGILVFGYATGAPSWSTTCAATCRLKPGWIGAELQLVTDDIARAVGLPAMTGGIVASLLPDKPAARAGLREGDVVLAVNAVPTRDVRAVSRAILASEPGRTVRVRIWRDGRTLDLSIAVETWPDHATNPAGTPVMPARGQRMNGMNLGLRLSELDDQLRQQYRLASAQQGVLVLGVAANSPGADAGFAAGDIIVRVQNTPITSNAELEKAV